MFLSQNCSAKFLSTDSNFFLFNECLQEMMVFEDRLDQYSVLSLIFLSLDDGDGSQNIRAITSRFCFFAVWFWSSSLDRRIIIHFIQTWRLISTTLKCISDREQKILKIDCVEFLFITLLHKWILQVEIHKNKRCLLEWRKSVTMHIASDKKTLRCSTFSSFLLNQIKNFIVFTERGRNYIKTVLTFLILATEVSLSDCCHNWCFGGEGGGGGGLAPQGNRYYKEPFWFVIILLD